MKKWKSFLTRLLEAEFSIKQFKGTNYAFYYSSDMRSVIQHHVNNSEYKFNYHEGTVRGKLLKSNSSPYCYYVH